MVVPDPAVEPGPVGGVRLAEIVGVLSLGTDLGLGQPMEQGLRATLLAVRLGESLGLGADELADVFYLPTCGLWAVLRTPCR